MSGPGKGTTHNGPVPMGLRDIWCPGERRSESMSQLWTHGADTIHAETSLAQLRSAKWEWLSPSWSGQNTHCEQTSTWNLNISSAEVFMMLQIWKTAEPCGRAGSGVQRRNSRDEAEPRAGAGLFLGTWGGPGQGPGLGQARAWGHGVVLGRGQAGVEQGLGTCMVLGTNFAQCGTGLTKPLSAT